MIPTMNDTVPTALDEETHFPQCECDEPLDKATVAELSAKQILHMTEEELIRVIRATHMSLITPKIERHLRYYDRTTLERLAYLARRCCRNQGY